MGKILLCLCAGLIGNMTFAQTLGHIAPSAPSPQTFKPLMPTMTPTSNYNNPSPVAPNPMARHQQQLLQYEQDRQQMFMREQAKKRIYEDMKNTHFTVRYTLPSLKGDAKTGHYYQAFERLKKMNPNDYSLKEATFLIENAFYENKRSYAEFDKTISDIGDFIKGAMKAQNLDMSNVLSKNLSIYQYIADTLSVNGTTHNPYIYDFNDYMGKENWDNMFVSKLILQGKGQCNSMPRLYLILAEELEAESYLAFAPNHSFIRFKDNIGEWHNAELTSGAIMSDIFMLDSGFIKAETVMNGNYMTGLAKAQVMAQLLNDLASGYISKFGYDDFIEQVIDYALELNPDGINSNLHKFNYQMKSMEFIAQQLQAQSPKDLQPYPEAVAMFKALAKQNQQLKDLGFEEMPQERYEAWIKSLEAEKDKQDEERILNGFKKQAIKG